jgi:hypothetical protein
MTFLNASLLAGSALVALPIVLHLIMRRKPRHLEFPALRFLEARRETNQRQMRLRHLLLLALRVAAILFLAAALARPSVKFSGALGSQKAPVAAALVFDTSMRMEYVHENRSRLEAAQDFGLWVLGQLPKESEIAVLDARRGPAAFQAHRGAARHRIEQLAPTAAAQPMTTVLEEAVRLLGTSKLAGREIYVFTDLARVSWPAESAAGLQGLLAGHPELGIYVVDVGVEKPTNTSLSQLRLSDQVISSRAPLTVSTDVRHRGNEATRTVELYLEDGTAEPGDRAARKGRQQIVELGGDGSQPVEFTIDLPEQGTHQGYVEISGADALACDNRRYFTVEVKDAWRVLVAAPTSDHGQFLVNALAPLRFRQEGRARFDCQVIEYSRLVQTELDDFTAVWLLDPPGLESATWTKLEDYARSGHGLAVCLGGAASSPGPLEAFRTSAALAVLPGKMVRQAKAPGDVYLKPGLSSHPMLDAFRAIDQTVPWELAPVLRYWQLKEPADDASVIVRFSDGSPAILERPLGAGRVVAMTTPISDLPGNEAWNDLPRGAVWPFVMLVNGMASYLAGSLDQALNYSAGETVVLRLGPKRAHRSYAMSAPGDFEVRLTPDLAQNTLIVTSTDAVGNYRVAAGGAEDAYRGGFSVNLASEQTDLARTDENHLEDVFGKTPFRIASQRSELEGNVNRGRVGRELFPALMILLAFVLAAEHVLANRFYRE